MSYTLTSAAVLAFELAHLPAGPTVAQTLLTGLNATTVTLLQLAVEDHLPTARGHLPAPTQLRSLPDEVGAHTTAREMADLLTGSRIDGAAALDRLVRAEILGPGSAAAAGVGGLLRDAAADVLSRTALAAWAVMGGPGEDHPSPTPAAAIGSETAATLGPHGAAVLDLLGSLGAPPTRASWHSARPAEPGTWTAAMHQACWAAHLSGRVRAAARAQLMGVLAFRAAGFGPAEVLSGSWNALSGVLQAVVVSDLLDSASKDALLAPARDRSLVDS